MTGTASVSKTLLLYRLFTVLPLFFFALYDYKHHKVCNAALLAFLPWCLFYVPLSILQEPLLPDALVILTAVLGFFCGGMLLLLISMVTNESIGGGDIKLVALLGICHGASDILEILVTSSLLALMHLTMPVQLPDLFSQYVYAKQSPVQRHHIKCAVRSETRSHCF